MKDFFLVPVLFSHFPFLVGLSLSSLPSLPPVCFPSLPISHSLSLLHTFFLFYSPSPSHSLLCGSLRVCRAASYSQLRWISYHGNQTQISNNGMLIMVITVWRLFQENERCYFSLEGLENEMSEVRQFGRHNSEQSRCRKSPPPRLILVQDGGSTKTSAALGSEGVTGKIGHNWSRFN